MLMQQQKAYGHLRANYTTLHQTKRARGHPRADKNKIMQKNAPAPTKGTKGSFWGAPYIGKFSNFLRYTYPFKINQICYI